MKDIVCLSTSNYYPFPTRKQNVMNRIKGGKILYFDPPVTYLAPLKDRSAAPRLSMYKQEGEQVRENITVYATPPVLPFGNKYAFINRHNQKKLARYVRRRMKEQGMEQPLLWCYSPCSAHITEHIPHEGLVYDCVDRHSAYTGFIDPKLVDGMEKKLAEEADMVFCTAAGLYDTLVQYNPHICLIPNGAAYELFSQAAAAEHTTDADRPIFGFVGMLQDCIAYDHLLALADAYPQGEIRLIGKVMPGVDISALEQKKNIHMLGLMPQDKLPEQIAQFDVCLNIFAPGRLSRDVSPLKFYEYLATGKPVVSTPEPLQVRDYESMIYIGESREDFVAACGKALAEQGTEKRDARMQAGRSASWDNRVRQMEDVLKQAGIFDAGCK